MERRLLTSRGLSKHQVALSEQARGKRGPFFTSPYGTMHPVNIHRWADPCPMGAAWKAESWRWDELLGFRSLKAAKRAGHYECERCKNLRGRKAKGA